jgi:UTP--glucose-1-phosphate uridylyltransferase
MIKKVVITAAGKGTRQYPATNAVQKELFPLVDRDGIAKPTIQIIAEEALNAGVEEICIVVQPGVKEKFVAHFKKLAENEKPSFSNKPWAQRQSEILERLRESITYVEQSTQEGFGHAVYCAKEWTGKEPFLLMLGDHVYISNRKESCTVQLIRGYETYRQTVFGLKRTPVKEIHLFGTATGRKISKNPPAYQLTRIVEKPDIPFAQRHLAVPGFPKNQFLCFFGIYLFTPAIHSILEEHFKKNVRADGEIQLATAISELTRVEGTAGLEIDGERLDMGTPLGYLQTQLALARSGVFAKEIKETQL